MNRLLSLVLLVVALAASSVEGFAAIGGVNGGEYFALFVATSGWPRTVDGALADPAYCHVALQLFSLAERCAFYFVATQFLTLFCLFLIQSRCVGSNFVISQRSRAAQPVARQNKHANLQMGSQAKFGIFSPAVYGAKIVLGNEKLNKLRGKGISLHSQTIGDFCGWAGAYHLRTRLIKMAKTNGDILGFLV